MPDACVSCYVYARLSVGCLASCALAHFSAVYLSFSVCTRLSVSFPLYCACVKPFEMETLMKRRLKQNTRNLKLLLPQTVMKHYTLLVDIRAYRLAYRSLQYNDTVSSYIAELVEKIKSELKAHFFYPEH